MRALWEEGESDMVLWMLKEEVEVRPGRPPTYSC